MNECIVFTIVARNYVAYAKTFFQSLRVHHPEIATAVMVIDNVDSAYVVEPGVKTILPLEIFSFLDYNSMAYSYDVTELSTAVKPFVFSHLLQRGYQKVLYFDPDVYIFSEVGDILAALDGCAIALTPHLLHPIPLDGKHPSEADILIAGSYNCGFIAVSESEETRRFLDWWMERLRRHCIKAHEDGIFVDQRWIDLVPGLFDAVKILKHPGMNVAYWNLHSRSLSENENRLADGRPIVFFHYSGYNAKRPTALSRHCDRLVPEKVAGLPRLLHFYGEKLIANGQLDHASTQYRFSAFSNGAPVDQWVHRAFRLALEKGLNFPDPYDVHARLSLYRWLNSPIDADKSRTKPFMTNYLWQFYMGRADVRSVFRDPLNQHREGFFAWLKSDNNHGINSCYIDAALEDGLTQPSTKLGINVAGYFRSQMGVGEAGRGHLAAIEAAAVPMSVVDFSAHAPHQREDVAVAGYEQGAKYPINVVCVNADQVPHFAKTVGTEFFENRYNIGVWWWELPRFPTFWQESFGYFDELWVGSEFIRQALLGASPTPVYTVPPVVAVPDLPSATKSDFGIGEDEFTFIFVFDFLSVFERKNPCAIIRAFKEAFGPLEKVRLVLKYMNAHYDPESHEKLLSEVANDKRITLVDSYLSREQKSQLMAVCDAYVSLHRSEGFGLTMAEAMAMGKPVIATHWSGNLDFMNSQNCYPVQPRLVMLDQTYGPYEKGQYWADPDINEAAKLMQRVRDNRDEATKRGQSARDTVRSQLSADAISRIVRARIVDIGEVLGASLSPGA